MSHQTLAQPIRACMVDLDGTLVDTLGDFEAALGAMLTAVPTHPSSAGLLHLLTGRASPSPAPEGVQEGADAARELLGAATRGSADCLGRPEVGRLAVGAAADLAGWDMTTVDRVGVHDPVAGLVLTGLGSQAALVAVAGRVLVEDGEPVAFDPHEIAARAREALATP